MVWPAVFCVGNFSCCHFIDLIYGFRVHRICYKCRRVPEASHVRFEQCVPRNLHLNGFGALPLNAISMDYFCLIQ